MACLVGLPHLLAHCKSSVLRCRPPNVRYKGYICQVHQVQPPVKHEPARLPMRGRVVWIACAGKSEGVEEEKGEDDDDGNDNTVPEFAVHLRFDALLAFLQVFESPC
jgi:hypothetical protein